jgi:hypothetical protein
MRITVTFTTLTALVSLMIPVSVSGQRKVGIFDVTDIEDAFGLESGSLVIPSDAGYDALYTQNYWTDFAGLPYYLGRVIIDGTTPRSEQFEAHFLLGTSMVQASASTWYERFLLGCYYEPRDPSAEEFLDVNGLDICNEFAGRTGATWWTMGFIDADNVLLYWGTSTDDMRYLTEFVVVTSKAALVADNEAAALVFAGPNFGVYEDYSTPDFVFTPLIKTNYGRFLVSWIPADLSDDCPEEICGYLLGPDVLPNPLAPAWPETVTENQCEWWPNANVCDNVTIDPQPEESIVPPSSGIVPIVILPSPPTPAPSKAPEVNVPCNVCGGDKVVTIQDGIIDNPPRAISDASTATCAEMEAGGLAGLVNSRLCRSILPGAMAPVCGCEEPYVPPAPATIGTTTSVRSGAAVTGQSLVALAASGLLAAAMALW